jgi:hypothetical protein
MGVGTHIFPEIYFDCGDIVDKFATGVKDAGGKLPPVYKRLRQPFATSVSDTVVNKDNSNRLPTLNCKLIGKQSMYKCTVNYYSLVAKQNVKKNFRVFSKKFEITLWFDFNSFHRSSCGRIGVVFFILILFSLKSLCTQTSPP